MTHKLELSCETNHQISSDQKTELHFFEQAKEANTQKSDTSFVNGSFFTRLDKANCRARIQVRDPNLFQISSLYQKRDRLSGLGSSVALLVGREENAPHEEKVIEIIFDTEVMTEEDAAAWYDSNKDRFT